MSDQEFDPRIPRKRGRRDDDSKYLHAVLESAARCGFAKMRSSRRFDGSRIGRGSVAARMLGVRDRYSGLRARRAIVKTRLVRLGGKGIAAAHAHLKYIQRDGVSGDGEAGQLYSAREDVIDGKTFLESCKNDRHQFRVIVSAEDCVHYDDLKPLIRRFMARMEQDLGTRLEWVAADHCDTLHPHTHIMLRGKDEKGENLIISPEYIKHGMRERLAALVSIDLGPRTDFEIEQRLRLEVEAERLTSIDRNLVRRMNPDRIVTPAATSMAAHALQTGRLRKLQALGLAEPLGSGKWSLAEELESTLRRLSERADIIRTMQRALKAAGLETGPADQVVHTADIERPIVGRLVARGLADEGRDTHYLMVDGVDGRSHYVNIGKWDRTEPLADGAIVRIMPHAALNRAVDQRIAAIAAEHAGNYSVDLHRAAEPSASGEFVQTHVRRLEAIRRRAGTVERLPDGSWSIPPNYLEVAKQYEAQRAREVPYDVEILSPVPLQQLPRHDGATWLDRELVAPQELIREQGFGREVRAALATRRAWLIEQGLALADEGRLTCRSDMLPILQRRELLRVAAGVAEETGLEFCEHQPGARVEGILRRKLNLPSGRFGMIEGGREFSLVPWRPVLERATDQWISGVVRRDGTISWTLARERGLEL